MEEMSDTSLPGTPHRGITNLRPEALTFSATRAAPTPSKSFILKTHDGSTKRPPEMTPTAAEKKNKLDHFKPVNAHHLWYGFATMEARATDHGVEEYAFKHPTADALAQDFQISIQEAQELLQVRHAFPHVEQKAYPTERIDGKAGQYLHLTQLPKNTELDEHGFERNAFQLTLWCDNGFNLTRKQVESQITTRLQAMGMQLGDKVSPNLVVFAPDDKWLGFAKICLANPQDCKDLLMGRRPLVIHIDSDSPVILKVEKAFELPTKGERIAVHVDGPNILDRMCQEQVTNSAIYESYRMQLEYEVLRSSKGPTNTFVHVFLANFDSTTSILKHGLKLKGNISLDAVPKKEKSTRAQELEQTELDFALTLTVSQIARNDTQESFTKAFTRLVSKASIKALYFVGMKKTEVISHSRKAHFVCSNAIVYNQYLNKKSVPCGKGYIDFNAHRRSLAGSEKPSTDILAKLGIGDIHKAIASTLETIHISTEEDKTKTLKECTPQDWKMELKRLESKIDSQEDRLEKRITNTVTKRASTHMESLFAKYASDLTTQVTSLISERTAFFIKNNPTFEDASNAEDDTLAIVEVHK